jgi:hypothetical protein
MRYPQCLSQHTVPHIPQIFITDCRELDIRRWGTCQLNFVKIYHVVQRLKWTHTHTHTHTQGQDNCNKNLVLFLLRQESCIKLEVLMGFPVAKGHIQFRENRSPGSKFQSGKQKHPTFPSQIKVGLKCHFIRHILRNIAKLREEF